MSERVPVVPHNVIARALEREQRMGVGELGGLERGVFGAGICLLYVCSF